MKDSAVGTDEVKVGSISKIQVSVHIFSIYLYKQLICISDYTGISSNRQHLIYCTVDLYYLTQVSACRGIFSQRYQLIVLSIRLYQHQLIHLSSHKFTQTYSCSYGCHIYLFAYLGNISYGYELMQVLNSHRYQPIEVSTHMSIRLYLYQLLQLSPHIGISSDRYQLIWVSDLPFSHQLSSRTGINFYMYCSSTALYQFIGLCQVMQVSAHDYNQGENKQIQVGPGKEISHRDLCIFGFLRTSRLHMLMVTLKLGCGIF